MSGVDLQFVSANTIGGTAAGAGNLISGNTYQGVQVFGNAGATPTAGNTIQGNFIGTNAAGTGAVGNANFGVIINGSVNNIIGGTTAAARNVVSGNAGRGVYIQDYSPTQTSTGNVVEGNYVGVDVSGGAALANTGSAGVVIGSASNNTIGGTAAGAGNVISGNTFGGLEVDGTGATGNNTSRATSSARTPPEPLHRQWQLRRHPQRLRQQPHRRHGRGGAQPHFGQ